MGEFAEVQVLKGQEDLQEPLCDDFLGQELLFVLFYAFLCLVSDKVCEVALFAVLFDHDKVSWFLVCLLATFLKEHIFNL